MVVWVSTCPLLDCLFLIFVMIYLLNPDAALNQVIFFAEEYLIYRSYSSVLLKYHITSVLTYIVFKRPCIFQYSPFLSTTYQVKLSVQEAELPCMQKNTHAGLMKQMRFKQEVKCYLHDQAFPQTNQRNFISSNERENFDFYISSNKIQFFRMLLCL